MRPPMAKMTAFTNYDRKPFMTKLEQIEKAVTALTPAEIKQFANWFAEFHADLWDQQIAADFESGRLDKFVAEAKVEIAIGEVREL